MKTCPRCKIKKDLLDFHLNKNTRDGRCSYCKACRCKDAVLYRKRDPERWAALQRIRRKKNWDYHILPAYGLTMEEYEVILIKQNGMCAICKNLPGKKRLHVDHDHKTGKLRGLLCFKCNVGLGNFGDSTELLKAALEYLGR